MFSNDDDRSEEKDGSLQLNLNSPMQAELGQGVVDFDEIMPSSKDYSPAVKPLPYESIVTKPKVNPLLKLSPRSNKKVYIIDDSVSKSADNNSKSHLSRKGIDSHTFAEEEKTVSLQDAYNRDLLDFSATNPLSAMSKAKKDPNSVGRVGSTLTKPQEKKSLPQKMNHAILLIKPHAVNVGMIYLITASLESANIKIVSKGSFTGTELLESKLFEKHRLTDKRYAFEENAQRITFTSDEGRRTIHALGESIIAAALQNRVFNCKEAYQHLKISESILHDICKMSPMRVKLRKGLHITRVDDACINDIMAFVYPDLKSALEQPIYIINGFYEDQKTEFEAPSSTTHFMCLEWDGNQLPWMDFLKDIVGDRNPAQAVSSSIRGTAFSDWRKLGLLSQPTEDHNCVYVSSSAADGFVDRFNWISGTILYSDTFGARMIAANIPAATILKWIVTNPVIEGKSYLDHMYGLDSDECIAKSLVFIGNVESASIYLLL